MLFTDPTFLLVFLPALLASYFLVVSLSSRGEIRGDTNAARGNWVLLAASVVFVVAGAGTFGWLMVAVAGLTAVAARDIEQTRASGHPGTRAEAVLTLGITGNLLLLGAAKYAYPLGASTGPTVGIGPGLSVPSLVVPFALTFVSCHAISLVTDVYRGEASTGDNPVRATLYLLLFPFTVAGPLVRYQTVAAQLERRGVGMASFSLGVRRFAVGLGKTWLIAHSLAIPAESILSRPVGDLAVVEAWVGIICFGLQIYFDLSGYADMAQGLGRMLGFRLPENFGWPYAADSLEAFWRRWYVSLTAWCRAHLSVPPVVLFVLVGLWHGPEWSFVRWGLFHGVMLWLEGAGLGRVVRRLPSPLRHLYLLLVVTVGWVIFREPTIAATVSYLAVLSGMSGAELGPTVSPLDAVTGSVLAVAVLGAVPLIPSLSRWVVTVDAMATSGLMLVGTAVLFVWRNTVRAVEAVARAFKPGE